MTKDKLDLKDVMDEIGYSPAIVYLYHFKTEIQDFVLNYLVDDFAVKRKVSYAEDYKEIDIDNFYSSDTKAEKKENIKKIDQMLERISQRYKEYCKGVDWE